MACRGIAESVMVSEDREGGIQMRGKENKLDLTPS